MKRRSGRIINITSVVGLTGNKGQANYAASKAGLIGFTKSVAKEYAGRDILANCIAPGYIETDMTSGLPDAAQGRIITGHCAGAPGTARGRRRRGPVPGLRSRRLHHRPGPGRRWWNGHLT